MRSLLHFKMGTHSLPYVSGQSTRGFPGTMLMCRLCNRHNGRHLVLECPAMQCVRAGSVCCIVQPC